MRLTVGAGVERATVMAITSNFFDVLGIRSHWGRGLNAVENSPYRNAKVASISERFRESKFGGHGEALGSTLVLGGEPFEVVGILDRSYRAPTSAVSPDVYIPVCAESVANFDDRRNRFLSSPGCRRN